MTKKIKLIFHSDFPYRLLMFAKRLNVILRRETFFSLHVLSLVGHDGETILVGTTPKFQLNRHGEDKTPKKHLLY